MASRFSVLCIVISTILVLSSCSDTSVPDWLDGTFDYYKKDPAKGCPSYQRAQGLC